MVQKIFIRLSILPLIVFGGVWFWLGTLEGWTAWASASAIFIPVAISAIAALFGLILIFNARRNQESIYGLAIATFLSGIPFLYFIGILLAG